MASFWLRHSHLANRFESASARKFALIPPREAFRHVMAFGHQVPSEIELSPTWLSSTVRSRKPNVTSGVTHLHLAAIARRSRLRRTDPGDPDRGHS